MELTGNPFVDTGFAVIAAKAGCSSVGELTLEKMREVHGDGVWLARYNNKLKSTSMIFTINSLATHPGTKSDEKRVQYYSSVITAFLNNIGKENHDERCECCGNEKSLDLDQVVREALAPLGYKDQLRYVGRDWFPLSGSITSDAQSLPSASRTPNICARCLFAVHYLPIGAILMNGKLAVFQSTSEKFWFRYVKKVADDVLERVAAGTNDTLGVKRGSTAIVEEAFKAMDEMRNEALEPGTTLFVWRYSNSGTGPDCSIEEIPSYAIQFLYEAKNHGLDKDVLSLIKFEGKKEEHQLLRVIQGRMDYFPLYPKKKYNGAKPLLFHLYQSKVRGVSTPRLKTAFKISVFIREKNDEKQVEQDYKELEKDRGAQSKVKKLMVEMIIDGKLSSSEYIDLFASPGNGSIINSDSWRFIRYYLKNGVFDVSDTEVEVTVYTSALRFYSSAIYREYIETRGRDRFQRDVIKGFETGKIGQSWLRRRFLSLAEKQEGFTYNDWKCLILNDSGWDTSRELLYRMRLIWTEWIHDYVTPEMEDPPKNMPRLLDTDLPVRVENSLTEVLETAFKVKGIKRFRRDILNGIINGEFDLYRFRNMLHAVAPDLGQEDYWERFTSDPEGNSIRQLRLFQMQLLVLNYYRNKII